MIIKKKCRYFHEFQKIQDKALFSVLLHQFDQISFVNFKNQNSDIHLVTVILFYDEHG
jgi:hypothetical protein